MANSKIKELMIKQRARKYETCISKLSAIDNSTAEYNIELLIEYKEAYINDGEENIPDRLIAELNFC